MRIFHSAIKMRSMMFFSGIYQGRRWFAWVHLRVSWFGFAGDCVLRLAAALGFEYWTLVDRVDEHGYSSRINIHPSVWICDFTQCSYLHTVFKRLIESQFDHAHVLLTKHFCLNA